MRPLGRLVIRQYLQNKTTEQIMAILSGNGYINYTDVMQNIPSNKLSEVIEQVADDKKITEVLNNPNTTNSRRKKIMIASAKKLESILASADPKIIVQVLNDPSTSPKERSTIMSAVVNTKDMTEILKNIDSTMISDVIKNINDEAKNAEIIFRIRDEQKLKSVLSGIESEKVVKILQSAQGGEISCIINGCDSTIISDVITSINDEAKKAEIISRIESRRTLQSVLNGIGPEKIANILQSAQENAIRDIIHICNISRDIKIKDIFAKMNPKAIAEIFERAEINSRRRIIAHISADVASEMLKDVSDNVIASTLDDSSNLHSYITKERLLDILSNSNNRTIHVYDSLCKTIVHIISADRAALEKLFNKQPKITLEIFSKISNTEIEKVVMILMNKDISSEIRSQILYSIPPELLSQTVQAIKAKGGLEFKEIINSNNNVGNYVKIIFNVNNDILPYVLDNLTPQNILLAISDTGYSQETKRKLFRAIDNKIENIFIGLDVADQAKMIEYIPSDMVQKAVSSLNFEKLAQLEKILEETHFRDNSKKNIIINAKDARKKQADQERDINEAEKKYKSKGFAKLTLQEQAMLIIANKITAEDIILSIPPYKQHELVSALDKLAQRPQIANSKIYKKNADIIQKIRDDVHSNVLKSWKQEAYFNGWGDINGQAAYMLSYMDKTRMQNISLENKKNISQQLQRSLTEQKLIEHIIKMQGHILKEKDHINPQSSKEQNKIDEEKIRDSIVDLEKMIAQETSTAKELDSHELMAQVLYGNIDDDTLKQLPYERQKELLDNIQEYLLSMREYTPDGGIDAKAYLSENEQQRMDNIALKVQTNITFKKIELVEEKYKNSSFAKLETDEQATWILNNIQKEDNKITLPRNVQDALNTLDTQEKKEKLAKCLHSSRCIDVERCLNKKLNKQQIKGMLGVDNIEKLIAPAAKKNTKYPKPNFDTAIQSTQNRNGVVELSNFKENLSLDQEQINNQERSSQKGHVKFITDTNDEVIPSVKEINNRSLQSWSER